MSTNSPVKKSQKTGSSFLRDERLVSDGARFPDNARYNKQASSSSLPNNISPHPYAVQDHLLPAAAAAAASALTALKGEVIFLDGADDSDADPEGGGNGIDLLSDNEYNTSVRMRMTRMLSMQYSATNPRTFSQDSMRSQLVDPLRERKGYIVKKALNVERSDNRWGSVLSQILQNEIPENGRAKGGLKANTKKSDLVEILVKTWTAVRKVYEHDEGKFSREASHELEAYLFTTLKRARENGGLSKQTTDEEISNYATKVGYHHQATAISQNMPTTDGLFYLRDQVMAQQHPKGATYTEQFGDMRTHGTGGAAKQRASNTRLEDASVLHDHPAAARNDEFDGMEWAIQDSLRQQQLLEETTTMQTCPFGVAPYDRNEMSAFTTAPVASASVNAFTPVAHNNFEDETPQGIIETREEAMMEIMLGGCNEDNERGVELQGIVDGLSKPRDVQIEKAHNLLEKKGKTAEERVNGLANLVRNKNRSKGNNK